MPLSGQPTQPSACGFPLQGPSACGRGRYPSRHSAIATCTTSYHWCRASDTDHLPTTGSMLLQHLHDLLFREPALTHRRLFTGEQNL